MQTDVTQRLPIEVLALIFQAYKDTCGGRRRGLFVHWVRATWVCKRWRDVALDTPTLWSTILVSKRLASHPALETQLNRARGVRLDLLVSCKCMPDAAVVDVFNLVLSKTKSVKRLKIIPGPSQATIVKTFVHSVAAEITSLSVLPDSVEYDDFEWTLAADVLPRLRHLALNWIIPLPGTPLLHLTQLEISNAFDDREQGYPPYLHTFLAACPNLESLRTDDCFEYAYEYREGANREQQLPVVTLPRLRHLSVNELALDISEALGALRLPFLSSFDIEGRCSYNIGPDCTDSVIPQNVSASLPPIRRSRSLSLAVDAQRCVALRGSSGDTPADARGRWSIVVDLLETEPADFRDNCKSFLVAIPSLIVPSIVVCLELHIPHGLPFKRNWARFFAAMTHLRVLLIGGGALLRNILPALEKDQGLCPELENLTLCATPGRDIDGDTLAEFIPGVVAAWARQRAEVGQRLRSLTVWTPPDDSDDSGNSDSGGESSSSDSELTGFALKLWDNLEAVGDSVRDVAVEVEDCEACRAQYELRGGDESEAYDDTGDDGSDEIVTTYY